MRVGTSNRLFGGARGGGKLSGIMAYASESGKKMIMEQYTYCPQHPTKLIKKQYSECYLCHIKSSEPIASQNFQDAGNIVKKGGEK